MAPSFRDQARDTLADDPLAAPPEAAKAAALEPPTHVRYEVLAVACSLALLIYIQRQAFGAANPEIKRACGLNDQQMGNVASAFLVAYGIFQVPGGWLGDRIGGRHLLTILVLGWSFLTGATAFAVLLPQGFWAFVALVAMRFLFGLFQAGAFPALAGVIKRWTPVVSRASAQGTVWMFSRLGGAVVPVLLLALFPLFGGWTNTFWVLAGLGVVWCALFWPWFRDHPLEMRRVNAAERALILSGGPTDTVDRAPVPWRSMLSSPGAWALCLMYGSVGFAGNFITNLLTLYLQEHRHLSVEMSKFLSGLPLACGIVSCLLGGALSDWLARWLGRKWGRRVVGMAGLSMAAVAVLGIPFVDNIWFLGFLLCAWFFFNDSMIGPAWASCTDIGEGHAGTLSGAMNMTGAFLGAAGTSLAGAMLKEHWYVVMFMIFACCYGFAALCWLAVDITKPLVPKS